jgi:predicted metalloprotease with PDZ domain
VTPGGVADRAGISAGDIITALASQPTASLAALQSVLAAHKPGDRVQAQLTRDGTDHRHGNPRHPHQLARPAARSAGTMPGPGQAAARDGWARGPPTRP